MKPIAVLQGVQRVWPGGWPAWKAIGVVQWVQRVWPGGWPEWKPIGVVQGVQRGCGQVVGQPRYAQLAGQRLFGILGCSAENALRCRAYAGHHGVGGDVSLDACQFVGSEDARARHFDRSKRTVGVDAPLEKACKIGSNMLGLRWDGCQLAFTAPGQPVSPVAFVTIQSGGGA